ncbi:MAG: endo-1,4-beta-xylanase [Bacteroidota bacterium]
MKNIMKPLLAISGLIIVCLLISCKNRSSNSVDKTETLQSVSSFPVGVAVNPRPLKNDTLYRNVVLNEFNSLTPESQATMSTIQPKEGVFDFSECDSIVDFAIKNNKRVHGVALNWDLYGNIDWIKNFHGDSVAWENILKKHIQTVVSHYKGKVKSWGVVNEAFNDDGTLRIDDQTSTENRGSIWARKLGKDYIARAFQYAHEADPEALLFYNDFGLHLSKRQKKIDAIVNMVEEFQKRNIPIHGLGMQLHIGVSTNNDEIESGMQKLAATGLLVHISEVSILVSDWKKDESLVFTEELQKKQSDKYQFIVQAYKRSVPADQRYGITIWGLRDPNSWVVGRFVPRDWPLLFDENYQKKKAYYGFLNGLKK